MQKLQLSQRAKNIQFYARIVLVSFLPVFAIVVTEPQALNTWDNLGSAILTFVSNPYLIGLWIVTLYQSFMSSISEPIEDNG